MAAIKSKIYFFIIGGLWLDVIFSKPIGADFIICTYSKKVGSFDKAIYLGRGKIKTLSKDLTPMFSEYKPILHGYEEKIDCVVACYHIEEIVAEKLRALLQTHKKLVIRGWNRPRARDYYDLWCILKNYSSSVNTTRLIEMLDKKCKHRDVSYQSIDDFFTAELVKEANQHWQSTLGVLVRGLPDCGHVLDETKLLIQKII